MGKVEKEDWLLEIIKGLRQGKKVRAYTLSPKTIEKVEKLAVELKISQSLLVDSLLDHAIDEYNGMKKRE